MTQQKIGEANVNNGVATTTYTIPGDAATGEHTLTGIYLQNDTYKRGQTTATVAIRIATTITVADVIASHGETATFTAQVKHTGNNNVPSGGGQVQFKLAGDNIGSPVSIGANGTATLEYEIPNNTADATAITAAFIQNNTYAGSVTSTSATLHIRKSTNVSISPVYANRGDSVNITALVTDINSDNVTSGSATLYVDNVEVGTETVSSGSVTWSNYAIANNATTGNHSLRVEYAQNNDYDAATGTGTLQVRMPTVLTAVNVSGNAETPQDTVNVTVLAKDENTNLLSSGSVGITIGSESEVIIAVNASGEATTTYQIPSNATGTITFSARFIQDNNYQSSTMATDGVITIRKGTVVTMDNINAVRGENINLTATVKDEDTLNVNTGTVEFDLE